MNTVCIIGRLGKQPELKESDKGAICNFSIAHDEGKDREPSWFDVTAFDKTAELVAQYLNQGDECAISGRLQQRKWEQDGQKRSAVSIIASRVDFLRKKGESAGGAVPRSRDEAVDRGVGGGSVSGPVGVVDDPFGDQ